MNEWRLIPKDKDGFFDETSDLYDKLPIIVAVVDEDDEYPELYYIDKDCWVDFLSDFNNPKFKYYMPCGVLEGGAE